MFMGFYAVVQESMYLVPTHPCVHNNVAMCMLPLKLLSVVIGSFALQIVPFATSCCAL